MFSKFVENSCEICASDSEAAEKKGGERGAASGERKLSAPVASDPIEGMESSTREHERRHTEPHTSSV